MWSLQSRPEHDTTFPKACVSQKHEMHFLHDFMFLRNTARRFDPFRAGLLQKPGGSRRQNGGLNALNMTAQGNALGKTASTNSCPEGACQNRPSPTQKLGLTYFLLLFLPGEGGLVKLSQGLFHKYGVN